MLRTVIRAQPWQSLTQSNITISLVPFKSRKFLNFCTRYFHSTKCSLKDVLETERTEQTSNVKIEGKVNDSSADGWLELDQAVNTYPMVRGFTAIGTGGDDFIQSMIIAVASVVQQPIPEDLIRQKVSSNGNYVSVNIGPIYVVSREQVQAVYNAMRKDDRTKYFL